MTLLALIALSFLARPSLGAGMSLTPVVDVTVNGVKADGEVDSFTWLFIPWHGGPAKNGAPNDVDQNALIGGALKWMDDFHCATRLVAQSIRGSKTPVKLTDTKDGSAETDFIGIKLNRNNPNITATPENLGKALYHEQLHILEKKFELRPEFDGKPVGKDVNEKKRRGAPHYPRNIPEIIKRLQEGVPKSESCEAVSEYGQLLDRDGKLIEMILSDGKYDVRSYWFPNDAEAAQHEAEWQAQLEAHRRKMDAMYEKLREDTGRKSKELGH